MYIPLIIEIFITMVFSAFFSGMEIAFVSSNRLLAEMDKEKNGLAQHLITFFYRHPNGFVSTMLVGKYPMASTAALSPTISTPA